MSTDYTKKYTDLVNYIPKTYHSAANTSLLRNLHNKFLTKEEAVPLLGYVGDTLANDTSPYIEAADFDRKINSLIPSVYTKLGSEEYIFSFKDVLLKLDMLGVDITEFANWGKANSFNFAPPINLDAFCNYSRYRWYGHLMGVSPVHNPTMAPEYYVIQKSGTSDWAKYNYWIHEADANEFFEAQGYSFSIDSTIQALRPIILFPDGMEAEMVLHMNNGKPDSIGTMVDQTADGYKTEFNQKPLFNLYLQDGSHSGFVSPIFYYAEGNEFPIDAQLKFRAKTNSNNDYVFGQGLLSKDGKRLLFYKRNGALRSIWRNGPEESPAYYVPDADGKPVVGDPKTDQDAVGAWKFPNQMFYNISHEYRKEIGYGDLLGHFVSIIAAQPGFSGNPYGTNNYRQMAQHDPGYGGRIKDYNSNFGLFLGLTNQLDSTVPGIINFAKLQYAQMLGAVTEYVERNIADLMTDGTVKPFTTTLTNTIDPKLQSLYDSFLAFVATRNDSSVFADTTSGIPGFPATLPYLGLATAVQPRIFFDKITGVLTMRHHDGHYSEVKTSDVELEQNIAHMTFLRSDGETTAGVNGYLPPLKPYKNQFWYDQNTATLKVYSITSDSVEPLNNADGDYYYNREAHILYQYNAETKVFVVVTDMMAPWKVVNTSAAISQLFLMVEGQLYTACPALPQKIDVGLALGVGQPRSNTLLEQEFAVYAANHGLDITQSDYDPTDAFTWNYKNVSVAGVPAGAARWFTIYQAYFGTTRPNLEPWVLQGYTSKPSWWDGVYASADSSRLWTTQMWSDIKNDTAPFPAPTGPWTKKIGVDKFTDTLLPPYVSPSLPSSVNALMTTIPSGIAIPFAFGENGPTEVQWRNSVDYAYDCLKVCFKLDPINFVNVTWGYNIVAVDEYNIDRHEHRKVGHTEFILHGETPTPKFGGFMVSDISSNTDDTQWTLTCVGNTPNGSMFSLVGNISGLMTSSYVCNTEMITAGLRVYVLDNGTDFNIGDKLIVKVPSMEVTYVPTKYAKFAGLNQWFVNYNRYNAVDMSIALSSNILRDWDLKLGYRLSGLVNTETFSVKSDQFPVHSSDHSIVLKQNKNIKSYWLNAIRIQLIRIGTTVTVDGKILPANKGEDWQFRIETFNTHNPTIQYYTYKADGKFKTYFAFEKANSKDSWTHLTERDELVTQTMPFIVTGIENVANVLFGYVDKLTEDGWRFNAGTEPSIDPATGRNISWQFYIERFINQQYLGVQAGTGTILNPFSTAVWFETPHGFVSNLRNPTISDVTTAQSVFDSFGNTIAQKDIQIFRNDTMTEIQSKVVIGGIHLLIDEYEHIVLFEDYTYDKSRQRLLYDPFLGVRVNRLNITANRQLNFNGRLSFGGHYIKADGVKRNIEASVSDMLNYYDADKMIDNSATAKHARGLLGYDSKSYMTDIDISDKTQFGFWRGLISNKGSNMSVDAFLNSSRFQSAHIDEYWAYKLASFGDARQLLFPEIKLNSADTQHKFTKIQFNQDSTASALGFINISALDEERWVGQVDPTTDLSFAAEQIAELTFTNVWPGTLYDLAQNGKQVIADTVQVFEQVFLKTGDMSPFLIRVNNFTLVNASTISFTNDTSAIDLDTYTLSAPRKFVVRCFSPSQPKFSPAKLIDYKNEVIVEDLALWDPARGSHTPEALEIVDMVTEEEPAKYNYSVRTSNNANYDPYRPWDNKDVGRIWWNTKDLEYIPYSDTLIFPNLDSRLSYWGALADFSSVELYEWVESSVHPSEYATLVKTQEGDSSIPADVRASGEVAMPELYSRKRTWQQRPIAWGYSDAPGSQLPFLSSVGEYKVAFRTDLSGATMAILSASDWTSAFEDLTIGNKISGGVFHYNVDDVTDTDNFKLTKPYGEAVVTGLNQSVVVGSSTSFDTPVFNPPTYTY